MLLEEIIFNTIEQKILKSMIDNPEKQFYERQIVQLAKVSVGGANQALKKLESEGLIKKEIKGKMNFYQVILDNPLIRQLKTISNLILLEPLIDDLKSKALKIVLFGSSAEGTNLNSSDIDLFVISINFQKIEQIIEKSTFGKKLQTIIKDPVETEKMIKKNSSLWQEIERGIILYEEQNES
jgi:predicted nucleotidyltransferase